MEGPCCSAGNKDSSLTEGAPGGSSCSTPQSEQASWRSEKLTFFPAYFIQTFFGKFLNFSEPF